MDYITASVGGPSNLGGFTEGEAVAFERLQNGTIAATHRTPEGNTDLFLAKPHVDTKGDCKFEVNGSQLEPWQVSKLALEGLFFDFGND